MDLRGRRVLVTGASRGIGERIARHAAAAGARVALVARSQEAIEKLAADLGGHAYGADLTDRDARDGLIDRVEVDGPVDVLVNNAGVDLTCRFLDMPPADIDALLELNLHAPMQLSRQVLPGMLRRGRGHIVNISSLAGTIAGPGLTAYTSSKAGLSHFIAGLRAELRGLPIGVTLVEIGPVVGEMMDRLRSYPPARRAVGRFEALRLLVDLDPEAVAARTVAAVQRGRRHVRMPRRAAAFPMIVETPRRITEVLLTGVDHHSV